MIYVYAITDRPDEPLPSQLGQHDEGLATIIWRDVVAVVSTFNGSQLSKTADELWRHEEVVEALMSDRAVVPVRFGTLLPSPQRVSDLLCWAYRALVRDIERVRGQVEIGMRFLTAIDRGAEAGTAAVHLGKSAAAAAHGGDGPATSSDRLIRSRTGPGSAYLWARLVRERELRDRQRAKLRLVRQAYELLASHANASSAGTAKRMIGMGPRRRFSCHATASYAFAEIVGEVANAHPELALLCTGPWPPYSFVNAGERATSGRGGVPCRLTQHMPAGKRSYMRRMIRPCSTGLPVGSMTTRRANSGAHRRRPQERRARSGASCAQCYRAAAPAA